MFSSSSYAGWTAVTLDINGATYYVDFERIRKHDGYVYWWLLEDYLKPSEWKDLGYLSLKSYQQGDCKLFRYKNLSWSTHKEPMGVGTGDTGNVPDKEWNYPSPNSVGETVLQSVCNR